MQYRINKKNNQKLSILGFGCMRFPSTLGRIDMKKTKELIAYAIEHGINYFDTAWLYPGNEEALGTALNELGERKNIYIASKLPSMVCKNPNDFDNYFSESLTRLKTDYIDYYLMHTLPDFALWEYLKSLGAVEWIERKKKEGAISQIGFSFHGNRDEFLRILDDYPWDFCQIQYNYFDENYQAGRTGLKAAAQKGIPVIIMEPLLGGKLARDLPAAAWDTFRKDDATLSPAARGLLWLWDQEEVSVVLSGMNSLPQVEENVRIAADAQPSCVRDKTVYERVRAEFQKSYKIHCTGCNYCQPCPQGVNISGCFSAYNARFMMGLVQGFQQYITSVGAHSRRSHGAGLCVQCGICEKHCPQNIPIRAELKNVFKKMEPFYFRLIMQVIRTFWFKNRQEKE